jgi:hypothetical protein
VRTIGCYCRFVFISIGFAIASFFSELVQAQDSNQSAAGVQSAEVDGPNAVTRAAVQRGALQCASRVEQLTRFVGFGPQAGALLIAPAAPVDRRLFSVQIELPAGASGNSLVDLDFAPGQANGCGASYQAVSYWKQNCDALANSQFNGLRKLPAIHHEITVLDGGPATKVFLMKAGDNGCVSIKKEIVL